MTSWKKEEIEIAGGTKVLAQMPVIVSASRSTDIPAFYSDWFMERLNAGYVKWFNPFNGNLKKGGVNAREFMPDEMCAVAQRIGELAKGWGITAATCGEIKDLDRRKVVTRLLVDDANPSQRSYLLELVDNPVGVKAIVPASEIPNG